MAHTPPIWFGKITSLTQPRIAAGYQLYNDQDKLPAKIQEIRRVCGGPLAMVSDYMVLIVSKCDIRVRRAATNNDIWSLPATRPDEPGSNQKGGSMSNFIKSGDCLMEEELRQIWEEVKRNNGTDVQLPSSSMFQGRRTRNCRTTGSDRRVSISD